MRIFISAGEPSGDIHGSNLIRYLKQLDPTVECVGFGGDKMKAAGCKLLYPLCELAVMWFARVLLKLPTFFSLLFQANRYFRDEKPDAIVLIDYPGFHWWLARRGRANNIPVFYFVPPQLWGWAGWRVKKMQRFVDHVLCTLPFEQLWYKERGVQAHFVGHPFFDEVKQQRLDPEFLARHRQDPRPIIGILPGSRNQEITRNLATQVRAAHAIHRSRPDVRFLVACFREEQKTRIDEYLARHPGLPIETFVGRTPEIIELSHSCLSVSGSVSLELLNRGKPTVIVYRIGKLDLWVCKRFITARFITLVNMLAGRELFPEFLVDHCPAKKVSEHLLAWLNDPGAHRTRCEELAALRAEACQPGSCSNAASFIVDKLKAPTPKKQAA